MRIVCLLAVMLLAVSVVAYAGKASVGIMGSVRIVDTHEIFMYSPDTSRRAMVSFDAGRTWYLQSYIPLMFSHCDGVYFSSGLPHVYKTSDAGSTWQLWSDRVFPEFQRRHMLDLNSMWINQDTLVEATSDGGSTWYEIRNNGRTFSDGLRAMTRLNSRQGWLLGFDSLYRTTDFGNTWTASSLGFSGTWPYAISFLDSLHAIRQDHDFQSPDRLRLSSDGGITWDYNRETLGALLINPLHGWNADGAEPWTGVPYSTQLSRTSDGGATWAVCPSPAPGRQLNGFDVTDDGKWLWAIFGDSIYNSTDGGDSWNWIPVNIDTSTAYVPCYDIGKQSVSDWSLLSAASSTSPRLFSSVYPSAISRAFWFNRGYAAADSMEPGKGYWVKFNGSDHLSIPVGDSLNQLSIPIHKGWNLIGGLSLPVNIESIIQTPDHILTTQAFSYTDGTYTPSKTLEPGRGYWIKANGDGILQLNASSAKP